MLVFIENGKISQVIAGTFISLAWLCLYGAVVPFADIWSGAASTAAQFLLTVQLFIAVLVDEFAEEESQEEHDRLT